MDGIEVARGERPGHYRVRGEVDLATADRLEQTVGEGLERGEALTLDLSGVSFMDSSGLRAILNLARRAEEAGKDPVLITSPSEQVRRLFAVALPDGVPHLRVVTEAEAGGSGQ